MRVVLRKLKRWIMIGTASTPRAHKKVGYKKLIPASYTLQFYKNDFNRGKFAIFDKWRVCPRYPTYFLFQSSGKKFLRQAIHAGLCAVCRPALLTGLKTIWPAVPSLMICVLIRENAQQR